MKYYLLILTYDLIIANWFGWDWEVLGWYLSLKLHGLHSGVIVPDSPSDLILELLALGLLVLLGLEFWVVVVVVHVDGYNVDHYLTDQNVYDYQWKERQEEPVHSNQILNRFLTQKYLLLIYNKPIQKHNARSQECVGHVEEPELVVGQHVVW